jgi:Uma2 family endonuclease
MTITLAPQKMRLPETAARPEDHSQNGLRRWTTEEYHRMIERDIFDGARVELLDGQIWCTYSSYLYRWTPEQYHSLIEAGFFEDGRVELLGGLIWDMAGQLTPHTTGLRLTQLSLEEAFDGAFEVRVQMPITLPDGTEPEPDIAVAPGTPLDYADHHPRSEELMLAVEISDSSLVKDRGQKLVAYAQAFVAEYWIVNLVNRQLEVYRQPAPEGIYIDFTIYLPGESVAPLNAPGKPIAVADLLPPIKQL